MLLCLSLFCLWYSCCLSVACLLPVCPLHVVCLLSASYWLQWICQINSSLSPIYVVCLFPNVCLFVVCLLPACCLPVSCLLPACILTIVFMLSGCCLYVLCQLPLLHFLYGLSVSHMWYQRAHQDEWVCSSWCMEHILSNCRGWYRQRYWPGCKWWTTIQFQT